MPTEKRMSEDQQALDLLRIEAVCIEFEKAHEAQKRPDIANELTRVEGRLRKQLLTELLWIELDWLHKTGQPVDEDRYRILPSEYKAVIDDIFKTHHSSSVDAIYSRGDSVGHYVIERLLGSGGFAQVFLARDTPSDCLVALKVLHSAEAESADRQREFLREAGLLEQIRHPSIVRILDFGVFEDGRFYLAMEYLKGQPLSEVVTRESVSPGRAIRLVAACAEAVASAHAAGIFHRDLKPSNIIISPDDRPGIIDFGLGMQFSRRDSHQGEVAGTVAYMAPEQVAGNAEKTGSHTDAWALGIILYELLIGGHPFLVDDSNRPHADQEREPLQIQTVNREIPQELQQLCNACLEVDPALRLSDCGALARELHALLSAFPELDADGDSLSNSLTDDRSLHQRFAAAANLWRISHRLPGVRDFLAYRRATQRSTWTRDEQGMMQAAFRHHLLRGSVITLILVATAVVGANRYSQSRDARIADTIANLREAPLTEIHHHISQNQNELDEAAAAMDRLPQEQVDLNLQIALVSRHPELIPLISESFLDASEDDAIELWAAFRKRIAPKDISLAVSFFETELQRFPVTDQQIAEFLKAAPAHVNQKIRDWNGYITPLFAFCQSMPADEAISFSGKMAAYCYTPVRYRLYAGGDNNDSRVAAIWQRGVADWRIEAAVPIESLSAEIQTWKQESRLPVDVSIHPSFGPPRHIVQS